VAPRDLLVLQLLGRGYGRSQVAQLLATTADAVDRHESAAQAALGAGGTAAAVARAVERGLILGHAGGAPAGGGRAARYEAHRCPAGGGYRVSDAHGRA
jgi:DNA-binding CsgD family transcriptional regulator